MGDAQKDAQEQQPAGLARQPRVALVGHHDHVEQRERHHNEQQPGRVGRVVGLGLTGRQAPRRATPNGERSRAIRGALRRQTQRSDHGQADSG